MKKIENLFERIEQEEKDREEVMEIMDSHTEKHFEELEHKKFELLKEAFDKAMKSMERLGVHIYDETKCISPKPDYAKFMYDLGTILAVLNKYTNEKDVWDNKFSNVVITKFQNGKVSLNNG